MSPSTPTLANDLIRIHKVITRGLVVGLSRGKDHLQSSGTSPVNLSGYAIYIHSFTQVLDAHHRSEDVIAFPAFRPLIPSAPYPRLAGDHQHIEMILANAPALITALSKDDSGDALSQVIKILEEINEVWATHIGIEEDYFSQQAVDAVMTPEEQARISAAAGQHSQEHSGPPYWVLPFVLFNLDKQERAVMAASFPPNVVNELVPKVWKDQWVPMKPYLLD